jgi:hypothetical protein
MREASGGKALSFSEDQWQQDSQSYPDYSKSLGDEGIANLDFAT